MDLENNCSIDTLKKLCPREAHTNNSITNGNVYNTITDSSNSGISDQSKANSGRHVNASIHITSSNDIDPSVGFLKM